MTATICLFALIIIEWGISLVMIVRNWRRMTTIEKELVGRIAKAEISNQKPPYFHV